MTTTTGPDVLARPTALAVARLLRVGARLAFALVAVGVALMLLTGVEPIPAPGSPPAPADWLAALVALDPTAYVWASVALTVLLPAAGVIVAAISYSRRGDRRAAGIAAIVVVVLAIGLAAALGTR